MLSPEQKLKKHIIFFFGQKKRPLQENFSTLHAISPITGSFSWFSLFPVALSIHIQSSSNKSFTFPVKINIFINGGKHQLLRELRIYVSLFLLRPQSCLRQITKYPQQKLRQGTYGHFIFRERETLDAIEGIDSHTADWRTSFRML